MSDAPRVLVSGVVLGQAIGGVRRHNVELLPRAAGRLAARNGGLSILAGAAPLPAPLAGGRAIETLASDVPFQPPWRRWIHERRVVRRECERARRAGRPFDLWHTAHLPVPRTDVPYTLTIHDLRDLELRDAPRWRRLLAPRVLAAAVDSARVVLTVSQDVRARIEARFSPRRVVVVPNAADHLRVHARASTNESPLLHVGHVERRKNLELLLRAVARASDLPALELAGAPKNGEDDRLRAIASNLGIAERVTFLGPIDDEELARLYARAAAVVIPSSLEGFGIGALEAQRARAPLAVSSAGALREVAGEGVPTFDPTDVDAAVRAIRSALATDSESLERHAERAARFTWDASADLLVEAWCSAV